jgi:hypothetical protein
MCASCILGVFFLFLNCFLVVKSCFGPSSLCVFTMATKSWFGIRETQYLQLPGSYLSRGQLHIGCAYITFEEQSYSRHLGGHGMVLLWLHVLLWGITAWLCNPDNF